tara:strand:+ start:710 stop:952 length:243 start_codon:yes stop_codon:yes gene_type:complete
MSKIRVCSYCQKPYNLFGSLGKWDCSASHYTTDHFSDETKMDVINIQDLYSIIAHIPDPNDFFSRKGMDKEKGKIFRKKK